MKVLDRWYSKRKKSPVCIKGITRKILVSYFNEWGFKYGVEVGVSKGNFSAHMLKNINGLNLIGIDPYDTRSLERFSFYNFSLITQSSEEAVDLIEDNSLDFVYIDGNHTFDFVIMDIIIWSKKVKKGGIISGHDYHRFIPIGVIDAVDMYTKVHQIEKWFITDEKFPTWFWRKE